MPTIKTITQDKNAWAHNIPSSQASPIAIANEQITDGGFLQTVSTAPVSITNCSNQKGNSAGGGRYFVIGWPGVVNGVQQAVSKFTIDATNCIIYQSPNECAIRMKCDDFQMTGGTVVAFLQPNGQPWKQSVELRHGKSFVFTGVTFQDGWPDIGQQQVAGQGYVTSQHIGTVTFINCKFTRWENQATGKVVSRQPGVTQIVYQNCVDPSGKTFTRTE